MYDTGTGTGAFSFGGDVRIIIGAPSPPPPKCGLCGGSRDLVKIEGGATCLPCLRPRMLDECFSGLMLATPPELRGSLYKRLASVYHPDAGCDDPLFMEILNRVRGRYP